MKQRNDIVMKNSFLNIFNKNNKNNKNNNEGIIISNEVAQKIFDKFVSLPGHNKKCIELKISSSTSKDNDNKRTACKFGGNPYWPKNKQWPKINGNDAIMYAQLNFADLPYLEGYPTSGIFQVFIDNINSEECIFIYHKNILDKSECLEEFPRSTINEKRQTDEGPLSELVCYIYGSVVVTYVNPTMDQFDEDLLSVINDELGTSYTSIDEMDKKSFYKIIDIFNNMEGYYGSYIGGYPYFCQYDCTDSNYPDLILQMDSSKPMIWGDYGCALFFAKKFNLTPSSPVNGRFYWSCF